MSSLDGWQRKRPAAAPVAPRTVPQLLRERARQDPHRVAIETHGVGTLTFGDWAARSARIATGLRDRGLRPGDRVGLVFGIGEWIDYAAAYCGVLAAGGVAVPCSDRWAAAELRYVLEHCGAVGLLHRPGEVAPTPGWTATVDELERAPQEEEETDGDPSGLAQILYTSGTTGRPKGVAASHANLTATASTDPRRRPLAHSERFLHAFPVGTNAGQTMLFNALDAHPGALTLPLFTPARFARLMTRAGSVFVVPAMAIELLGSGALAKNDLSGVRLVGSTAAALPGPVAAALAAALPQASIVNYYTSTEAAPAQTSMVFDPARPASLGRSIGGGLRITDPDGKPVPAGEPGEVWLRSPHPRSYFRDAESTGAVFRGGWVRMGDLGRLDDEGYLYLLDREQDVIKSGAHKVSTLAVEAALHEHPAVVEAAVVGVEHRVLGHAVAAAVVARDEVTAVELRAFLRDRLSPHEVPGKFVLLDALPRNDAGKVVKRELRALLTGSAGDPEG
ncbi:acyl-CoA synthetase (AMP-forming)/AMP-acid ligase II [Allocatelliglobosispora scoriae]|uniref:Acyl-CoA synthetase (AMP-forming)/AMP-acid ligase II n=1 Tax=Allocatelliglobosispora scoriae TaxID=643052 RepID=A0A841BMK2_9ACTN|nr:class I adenylate-forming enzyme family protein [Allocatelliglobosispora scoriae]MBB5868895.1 acyl-CoA synthetase (AMP-forming)/AMP-acid ligase II [Allocatelliglobosispora scoriae]